MVGSPPVIFACALSTYPTNFCGVADNLGAFAVFVVVMSLSTLTATLAGALPL